MSFIQCVRGLHGQGLLKKQDLKKIEQFIEEESKKLGGDPTAAQKIVAEIAAERFAELIGRRRRTAAIELSKVKEIVTKFKNTENFESTLDSTMQNADNAGVSYAKLAKMKAKEFFFEFQPTFIGTTGRKAGIRDIVKALMGENVTNKEAIKFATGIRDGLNFLHREYNTRGGILDYLENYMPTMWMREKIERVDKSVFIQDMLRTIRKDRISELMKENLDTLTKGGQIDPQTAADAVSPEAFFGAVYDNLSTGNLKSKTKAMEDLLSKGKKEGDYRLFGEQRNFNKKLHFNNADDYLEMMEKYGYGEDNLYSMFDDYFNRMGMELGALHAFGPNLDRMEGVLNQLNTFAKASGKKAVKNNTISGYMSYMKGRQFTSDPDDMWSKILNPTLSLMRANLMGSAAIGAIADPAFMASAARLNGLPVTKMITSLLEGYNPADAADRAMLQGMGSFLEAGNRLLMSEFDKYSGVKGKGDILTNLVINASGLNKMTHIHADAAAKTLYSTIYAWKDKEWSGLNEVFRDAAESVGITKKDWDLIRSTEAFEDTVNGVSFIRAYEVADAHGVDVGLKLLNWERMLRLQGTNEPTLLTKLYTSGAIFAGDARQNSGAALAAKSLLMLKAFPLTAYQLHIRGAFDRFGKMGAAGHMATLVLSATMMSALAIQVRNVLSNKTPESMEAPDFWLRAMIQSGGLGLFGDIFFKDYSKFGSHWFVEAAGPVGSVTDKMVDASLGNMAKMFKGKDTTFAGDTAKVVQKFIPGQNLWFLKAFTTYLFDWLDDTLDNEGYEKRQERLQEILDERGQRYFFEPLKYQGD